MSSPGALADFKSGPLYFFDQPTRRGWTKAVRLEHDRLLHSNQENGSKTGDELTGDARGTPDTSPAAGAALSIKDHAQMDAYKRAAPRMLDELAGLLSQNKRIKDTSVPHGITNILSYSWQDLAAGAVPLKSPEPTYTQPGFGGCVKVDDAHRLASDADEKDAGQSDLRVVGNGERTPDVSTYARVQRRKHGSKMAHSATTRFSILSSGRSSSGWRVGPEQLGYDEPPQIALCQWVVQRLQAARNPERLQRADPSRDKPPVLRHYGRVKARALPATLVNGLPWIPEVAAPSPAQHKLHYRINDGSSFIYYPSGRVAVCHSHSALPCGGFYTNVFSDSQRPAFLATVTAFGHGAVTHPLSAAITALWDQDGGFVCDQLGNVTKEWRWKTDLTLRGKIVIQVSELISVRLFSGSSALLSFRCDNESVHLPLSGLSPISQPKETADSAVAHNPLLPRTTESPAASPERKRNLALTPAIRTVGEVEVLEEPPAQRKRVGPAVRELRRLQQRARGALDNWLDYYREAIGIRCPDIERPPDAPARTRPRGEGRSAALPSLNPPERTDATPEQGGKELRRRPTVLAEREPDTSAALPRATKKRAKDGPRVTHIGPLQIHGSIQLESVIIPLSPESQASAASRCPAPPLLAASGPLTVCPVLLRAALLGEGGRKRCCCSATRMPAVTDLEYDAFLAGQPAHSKQILVVCVAGPSQPVSVQAAPGHEPLEQLYRRRNRHRTTPCTQCQMDSFRLVRYEISAAEHSSGAQNVLLQQRHNAAPGMVLMYIRGKLLFVGYIISDPGGSVVDLQKQVSRARGGYRSGVSLPPDHKFSDTLNSRDATLAGRDDVKLLATVEKQKASERHVAKSACRAIFAGFLRMN